MPGAPYKFGKFELDPDAFELRRNGRPVKLERIPLELLILLTENESRVVARQQIVERLWGKDVFVDTEHGINVAIRKIRAALREDAEHARFVQTVPGKGYRFVVDAGLCGKNGKPEVVEPVPEVPSEAPAAPVPSGHPNLPRILAAGALLLLSGALLAFNTGGIRDRIFPQPPPPQIRSIAVLPLTNLSGEDSEKYFADGMTDELITMLAKNTPLRVVSRTSIMQYEGVHRPLRDVARELNADSVLEGSISRSANRVHVTVQLFAADDRSIWADSFDRDRSEASSLPSELAHAIAEQVKVAVSPAGPQREINPEAHDAYLHGRFFWFRNNTPEATRYFERAIQIQPDYAAAWSGLGDAYAVSAVLGLVRPQDVMDKADAAVRKALQLDDTLPEAHNSMAAIYLFHDWNWQKADAESQRAIELDPNFAEAHHLRSYILLVMNRPEEALKEQERASELDPFARPAALGRILTDLRQYDAALNELRLRREGQPQDVGVRTALSDVYWLKGMEKESVEESERALLLLAGNPQDAAAIHKAFQKGGQATTQWSLAYIQAHMPHWNWWRARLYARLQEKEKTISELQIASAERDPFVVFLQNEPLFDFLHTDKRYRDIVRNMGLPPTY